MKRDNVIPMPTRPMHELEPHVMPESGNTTGSKLRDFALMWLGGIDWRDVGERAVIALCIFAITSSVLAIAIGHGWLDLPQLADLLGLPH